MNTYRYAVDADGTVVRGSLYKTDDPDQWRYYWDADSMIAFYDGYRDGLDALTEGADTERAMAAYRAEKSGEKGAEGALDRLAVRLTGNAEARFISVSLDRGLDLFALSWDGDPNNEWRDEIEAVYHGDVYRIEVEQWCDSLAGRPGHWVEADDFCDEWYGIDNAENALAKDFPLTEFPAQTLVSSTN